MLEAVLLDDGSFDNCAAINNFEFRSINGSRPLPWAENIVVDENDFGFYLYELRTSFDDGNSEICRAEVRLLAPPNLDSDQDTIQSPINPLGGNLQTEFDFKKEIPASVLSVFPNPFSASSHVMLQSELGGMHKISIVNLMGQEIYTHEKQLEIGKNQWELNLNQKVTPGIYLLVVENDLEILSLKLEIF